MEEHNLTEDEAMTRIRKASTNSGKPVREVAEAIILAQQVDSQGE